MGSEHIGSSCSEFLDEEGLRQEVEVHAIKQVLAWQIQQKMTAQDLSRSAMAQRMRTSRTQLERLLDPDNDRVQFDTMQRAAAAIGRSLHLELR